MSKSQKLGSIIGVFIVILALGIGIFKIKRGGKEEQTTDRSAAEKQEQTENKTVNSAKEGVWIGTLKSSNNPSKGNLMLVTSEKTIYIQTGRDFNQLLGKVVNVTYEGSLDNFVLGNVTEAQAE